MTGTRVHEVLIGKEGKGDCHNNAEHFLWAKQALQKSNVTEEEKKKEKISLILTDIPGGPPERL